MKAKYRGRGWAMLSSRTPNTGEGSSGRSERRSARTRSSSGGSSGRNRSKLRQACSISLAARARASSRGASSRSGESAGPCSSIASMLPAPPQAVGHVGNYVELPPLPLLVDLVPDHDGGEPALRRDSQPIHPVHVSGGFLHAAQQVVLFLEPRCLGADEAHDHRRPGPKEPDRLQAPVAPQVVPLHQEAIVRKLAEDLLEPVAEQVFGELPYDRFLVEW